MDDILKFAISQIGVAEIPGKKSNEVIIQYAKDCGFDWYNSDEISWCSVFVNLCALKTGYERTNSAKARSWLNVGTKIDKPETGCLVVFWRESVDSWKGHVAFYLNEVQDSNGKLIRVLGGNQNNQVRISIYNKANVLAYIKLSKL